MVNVFFFGAKEQSTLHTAHTGFLSKKLKVSQYRDFFSKILKVFQHRGPHRGNFLNSQSLPVQGLTHGGTDMGNV